MIRRILAAILLLWALGFAAFVVLLPGPAAPSETDAIIVLTGGENRIDRGIALLKDGHAERMLVSGVNRTVRPAELAAETGEPEDLFECCIDLGQDAVDTRSNGAEAARWMRENRFTSVRLVTTDWHMPRARFELARELDDGVDLITDAVASEPSFTQLFLEYNKYLLRRIGALIGI
ncbi:YdcF family protein [Parasphingopyxis marina]|uniref:YdcF family protein n=1 Tax=Parasphingopyxis marina TaxID=2761622 RepID=A0A842HTA6_9SPHN|nr:YdcF family protein [Parasphingopyxis marina]MBC2776252.1 YdcF family protein [Parasphingopyxis marina]